jgi:adenylate cyclase
MRRRRRIRVLLLAAVAALSVALPLAAYLTHTFRSLELSTVDARFSIRGADPAPDDLVVVGVDRATLDRVPQRWPFGRDLHARVIENLRRAGAKVVAFDVFLSAPSERRPRFCGFAGGGDFPPDDCALLKASARARNVVFSTTEVGARGNFPFLGANARQVLPLLHARGGYTGIDDDADGSQRRFLRGFNGLKSLAVAAVERERGRPVGGHGFGPDGSAWIDYLGPPRTVPTVPYWKVLAGREPAASFRGKTVVVGATDSSLKDVFHASTSGGELMSGPELQANAIATVRRGMPLRPAARGWSVLLILVLGIAAPLACMPLRLRGLAVAAAAGLVYLVAAQLLFDGGTIVAVVYPLAALVLGAVGALLVQYLTETRERRRTRQLFARFVPEDVVDEVLDRTDDDLRIGGVEREGTVMFADLRGFTGFAERLPVERVIEVLNRYLGAMSEAILDAGGTLVAYMGDGIMAVFGAPIEQDDHADRGLAAALEMRDARLPAFNDWLLAEGLADEGFRIGIGLNSGAVMSGNVGSERRLEYTAIGDTTNTASRIEGMTKGTPHQLLLAEATRDALRADARGAFLVGEFEVRGRERSIRLWSVPEPGGPAPVESPASAREGTT